MLLFWLLWPGYVRKDPVPKGKQKMKGEEIGMFCKESKTQLQCSSCCTLLIMPASLFYLYLVYPKHSLIIYLYLVYPKHSLIICLYLVYPKHSLIICLYLVYPKHSLFIYLHLVYPNHSLIIYMYLVYQKHVYLVYPNHSHFITVPWVAMTIV